MKDAAARPMSMMRSLGIVAVAVAFAVCAALAALSLAAMNWPVAAVAVFVAVGIGYFGWRFFRGEDQPVFWPMMSVWIATAVMMLAAVLAWR